MLRTPARSRIDVVLFVLGPLGVALLALWLGQSTSWDLRNYHWYNPYALLEGRMGFDVAVAHHATFYNPLVDLPLWWIAPFVSGAGAAVFLGLLQGLNFSFLYLIARDTLVSDNGTPRRGIAAVLALLGVTGGYAISLTGAPHYDNVVSVGILAALWLLLRRRDAIAAGVGASALVVAGLLIGAVVGMKLPTAPFGLAILAAASAAARGTRGRLRAVLLCGGAAFLGFLATTGWWFFVLWRETGNPVFPYFNDVIGSTLILDASYRDERFLPQSWLDALLFPIRASLDWRVSADGPLTDWRIAFAYVTVIFAALFMAVRRTAAQPLVQRDAVAVLFAFAAIGYASWLAVFAIYRYIVTFEMLAPLLVVAAVGLWPLPRNARAVLATIAVLAAVLLTPIPREDRPAFADRVVHVDVPPIARPDATMALMAGVEPMAFVIPAFPPRIPWLRIDGYLVGPGADTPMLAGMRQRIATHLAAGGDLRVLFIDFERARTDDALRQLGLRRGDDCTTVQHNLGERLHWCPVGAAP